jgi:hypothetical protein
MIEDKKEEEKLIQYSQYRKKGLLSDISLYGASFLGQMIDPISVFTGVGIEAAAAKNRKGYTIAIVFGFPIS